MFFNFASPLVSRTVSFPRRIGAGSKFENMLFCTMERRYKPLASFDDSKSFPFWIGPCDTAQIFVCFFAVSLFPLANGKSKASRQSDPLKTHLSWQESGLRSSKKEIPTSLFLRNYTMFISRYVFHFHPLTLVIRIGRSKALRAPTLCCH